MDRTVLLLDCDSFYASCEMAYNPYYKTVPMAVGGDEKQRHGIILAANYIAKKHGVRTGQTLWEAKSKCANLLCVPSNGKRYQKFSQYVNSIYQEYTPLVEMGGLDESYVDITGLDGESTAKEIRARVEHELGITVSAGISFNKIFAKLASEMRKPNGQFVITSENYKQTAWPLPVSDLLMVGNATFRKLLNMGIRTIGDLATTDPEYLKSHLGKHGLMLYLFANGRENSPVKEHTYHRPPKSISNSWTTPRDLVDETDVKVVMCGLAESVAVQMREQNLLANTVVLNIRDNELTSMTRQRHLLQPSQLAREFVEEGMRMFRICYDFRREKPIRTLGIAAKDFVPDNENIQLSFLPENKKRQDLQTMERTLDDLRRRYGFSIISPGVKYLRPELGGLDARKHNPMTPAVVSYGV